MKVNKITTDNYFDTIEEIGFENLPQILKESHMVILSKTDEGEDWSTYKSDADLKRMVNLAFRKLEEFMHSGNKELSGTPKKNESEKSKKKNPYGEISTEVRFIHRFLEFHDKILYKKTFEIFIDELQKAIQEKKITKKSPVAKDIIAMQQAALNAFNTMKNAKHFVLKPTTIKHLKSIIEKFENAYDDIDEDYTNVKKKKMDLNGIDTGQKVNIMPSTDFTNLHFDSIGFSGKWLDFIGDPAPGFTAMVFGMPKMGKSYLCVDFAGYLARNHGRVLYVAKEEKLDATLQQKLKDKNVAHENLFVADALPSDLSGYEFIFLDSVNKLGLTPKDLDKLKADNKGKSFIYIFQATKGGKFKGNNEFQHDVDVVIEVPEQGKAVQFGRFNQGGELNIFPDSAISLTSKENISMLDGIKKKPMNEQSNIEKSDRELTVKIAHNSWGDVAVLKHGADWHAILHPEDIETVAGLKTGESCEIKDEQGYVWNISNNGDGFNIKAKFGGHKGHFKLDTKYLLSNAKWTEPEHLSKQDHNDLKEVYNLYREKKFKEAMKYASDLDTIVREEVPGAIWKEIGGELTPAGEAKLRKNRKLLSPSSGKAIKKETELGIPLEELAMELIPKNKPKEGILELIYNKPKQVENAVEIMAQQAINVEKLNIKVKSVKFKENDSDKLSHGASYYTVVLEGEKSEIKKIAGEDKLFYCEW